MLWPKQAHMHVSGADQLQECRATDRLQASLEMRHNPDWLV